MLLREKERCRYANVGEEKSGKEREAPSSPPGEEKENGREKENG